MDGQQLAQVLYKTSLRGTRSDLVRRLGEIDSLVRPAASDDPQAMEILQLTVCAGYWARRYYVEHLKSIRSICQREPVADGDGKAQKKGGK